MRRRKPEVPGRLKTAFAHLADAMKRPAPPARAFRYGDLCFFAGFGRRHIGIWALGAAFTAFSAAVGSLLPLGGKAVIDFIVLGKAPEGMETIGRLLGSPEVIAIAVLAGGAAMGMAGVLQRYLMFRFEEGLTLNVQNALFNRILGFPVSFFRKTRTGYLVSRVSEDIGALRYVFSESTVRVSSRALYLLFGLSIAFMLSKKLALIFVLFLPFYALINYFFSVRLRGAGLGEREASARVSKEMQEVFSGVETMKAYGGEEAEAGKVTGAMRSAAAARIKSALISLVSGYSTRGFQFITVLFLLWAGVGEMKRGGMTVGDYVAFASYVMLVSASLNALFTHHLTLQPVFSSLSRLRELFSLAQEETGALRPESVRGELRFEDVSFSYGEGRLVLGSVSFGVAPGEVVALAGQSGAGKTTIVNLLLKFYRPGSGTISLDGISLAQLDTGWLRKNVGVVSQDVFLFDDTIENNIRYGRPSASSEDVRGAAKMAGLDDEIVGFPEGYQTLAGERGIGLSAGQRQRISIARAFLKDPPVLVFDEPASALDPHSEALVKESLKRLSGRRTMIVISHRASTLESADRVLLLEGGRIKKDMPYREFASEGA